LQLYNKEHAHDAEEEKSESKINVLGVDEESDKILYDTPTPAG